MNKNEYSEYMSEEDKLLAKKDNQSLGRFVMGLLLACTYGALAFFLVWRMHDVLPSILNMYFPGTSHADPFRLYRFIVICAGGFGWFITFCVLWFKLAKPETTVKRKLVTLACWCAGCALAYVLVELAYRFLLIG